MRPARPVAVALLLMVAAIILQTTLFARLRPFGVAPDLVLLLAILSAHFVPAEASLLLGFTGGLLMDLLGSTPLGLRGLTFTVVAYAAVRTRDRSEHGVLTRSAWVALLTLGGIALFLLVGTLFGQAILLGGSLVGSLVLIPLYNVMLGLAAAPLMARVLRAESPRP
ncbi:MAG: rod shape-determining protein MreD [Acidimicrobiia bacterium]